MCLCEWNAPQRHPRPAPAVPRRISPRLLRWLAQARGDLAHDGDRNFGRRHGPDLEPDGRVDACQRAIGEALRLEALDPARGRLLRAERADGEAIALKRMGER